MRAIRSGNGLLIALIICIAQTSLWAQKEIPASIKDLVAKGISVVDSAKGANDVEQALMLFKKAAKLEPSCPEVHFYLGETLAMLQGNTRNAITELKKYLELYPTALDKDNVSAEVARLEKTLQLKQTERSLGLSFMSCKGAVLVRQVLGYYRGKERNEENIWVGDKLLKIQDKDVTELNLQDVLMRISDEKSDSIKLTLIRDKVPFDAVLPFSKSRFVTHELGERDLNAVIAESKIPIVVLWNRDVKNLMKTGDKQKVMGYEIYHKILSTVMQKYPGKLSFVVVNLDQDMMIGDEFTIANDKLPIVSFYKDGKLTKHVVGFDMKEFDAEITKLTE